MFFFPAGDMDVDDDDVGLFLHAQELHRTIEIQTS